jgi:PHD/YefM family antitoxin component YafN of YafNO toxin-antitoxin module
MKTTLSVSDAQRQLPKLLRQDKVIAVMRHDSIAGFVVPRERFESMLDTLETLANPEAMKAIKKFKAGKMKFLTLDQLDEEMEQK